MTQSHEANKEQRREWKERALYADFVYGSTAMSDALEHFAESIQTLSIAVRTVAKELRNLKEKQTP